MAKERREFFDVIDHYIGQNISDESEFNRLRDQIARDLAQSLAHKTPEQLHELFGKLQQIHLKTFSNYNAIARKRTTNTERSQQDAKLIQKTIAELKNRIAQNKDKLPQPTPEIDEDEDLEEPITDEEKLKLNEDALNEIVERGNRIYIEHETAKVKLYLVQHAIDVLTNVRKNAIEHKKLKEKKEKKRRPPESPRRR